MFLGENLLAWLVLAFGGAMFMGNVLALFRPPAQKKADAEFVPVPKVRTILMALVGLVAAIWALVSL